MERYTATGRDAFGLVFDNLLQHDARQTRKDLMLYALLNGAVLCPDSWFMTNGALQSVLMAPDGVTLLRDVLVPVRRDSVDSFKLLHEQVTAKKMFGLCATDEFVGFLDREAVRIAPFALSEVGASYKRMSRACLAPETLIALGVSEASAITVDRLVQEAGDRADTNTFVKDDVCPHLAEADRELTMQIARAPYGLNLPTLLGSGIAGPLDYRGHEILAALKQKERTTATLNVTGAGRSLGEAFHASLGDAAVNWLFSDGVLEQMTAEDLVSARATSDRSIYLDRLADFLAKPEASNWSALVAAMTAYLQKAANEVMDRWLKSGRFGNEPGEGQITIEGANTLKIITPSKPVELSGVASATVERTLSVSSMQVVGRTLSVPVREETAS